MPAMSNNFFKIFNQMRIASDLMPFVEQLKKYRQKKKYFKFIAFLLLLLCAQPDIIQKKIKFFLSKLRFFENTKNHSQINSQQIDDTSKFISDLGKIYLTHFNSIKNTLIHNLFFGKYFNIAVNDSNSIVFLTKNSSELCNLYFCIENQNGLFYNKIKYIKTEISGDYFTMYCIAEQGNLMLELKITGVASNSALQFNYKISKISVDDI